MGFRLETTAFVSRMLWTVSQNVFCYSLTKNRQVYRRMESAWLRISRRTSVKDFPSFGLMRGSSDCGLFLCFFYLALMSSLLIFTLPQWIYCRRYPNFAIVAVFSPIFYAVWPVWIPSHRILFAALCALFLLVSVLAFQKIAPSPVRCLAFPVLSLFFPDKGVSRSSKSFLRAFFCPALLDLLPSTVLLSL